MEVNMELVNYDDRTVTVKMDRSEDLALLFGLVLSVHTQYDALDEVELGMTSDQVMALLRRLEKVGAGLPRP